MNYIYALLIGGLMLFTCGMQAQQNPQYTQYMYNTQIINPAYVGTRSRLSMGLLYRSQWVGFDKAPKTGTFTINSPVGKKERMGLGLSVVYDKIGISNSSHFTLDYSYAIPVSATGRLSFGLKAGAEVLNVNFSELNLFNPSDPLFQEDIDNRWQPQIGGGIYYHTKQFYVGLSVPNFLETKHYEAHKTHYTKVASRMHYYLIAGYVFDLGMHVKFKPATMIKVVEGAPLQWDISANLMFDEVVTVGLAYRYNTTLSGLVGVQITKNILVGFTYDGDLNAMAHQNSGSFEGFVRFELLNGKQDRVPECFF